MLPAHKGLRAGQHRIIPAHVEFRLIEHRELLFLKRSRKIVYQLFRKHFCLVHGIVKKADRLREVSPDRVRRHFRPVEPALDVKRFIRVGINSHPQPDVAFAELAVPETCRQIIEDLFIIGAVKAIEHEFVRLIAAYNASGLLDHFQRVFRNTPENFVPVRFSVTVVDRVEMVDIDNNGVCRSVLVVQVELVRVMIEELFVVELRQMIALRPAEGIPVFGKFYGTPDAGKDDL